MGFTIKDILTQERNRDLDYVVLFREGTFWKAYEKSAFVLAKRYDFKPTKRYIKNVQEEIVSIGFPANQLSKYLSNAVVQNEGANVRALVKDPCEERAFEDWKNGLTVKEKKTPVVPVTKIPLPEELKFDPFVELPKNFYLDNLPVYRSIYDLLLNLTQKVQKFSKDYRYSIGDRLIQKLIEAMINIYRANETQDIITKIQHIEKIQTLLLETKLYLRVLHDVKQLTTRQFANLAETLVLSEKHVANWKNYNNKK